MNWFNWYLDADEINNYFWRFALVLIFVMIFEGVPGPGNILYWLIIMDVLYWFVHKKPKLKAMNDDN